MLQLSDKLFKFRIFYGLFFDESIIKNKKAQGFSPCTFGFSGHIVPASPQAGTHQLFKEIIG